MQMTTGQEDKTERFVDEAEKPIPPRNTWDELTTNQLIDLQIQLEDKAWAFAKNPAMFNVLNQAVISLRALIASRAP